MASVSNISTEESTVFYCYSSQTSTCWMIDTRCSDHITSFLSDFIDYKEYITPKIVKLADSKQTCPILGIGTVQGQTLVNGKANQLVLQNTLYMPSIGCRYLSQHKLMQWGIRVHFELNRALLPKGKHVIATAALSRTFHWVDLDLLDCYVPWLSHTGSSHPIKIWHQQLRHLNWQVLQKYTNTLEGINLSSHTHVLSTCEGCQKGKSTHCSYPPSTSHSKTILNCIHIDLARPMQTQSI